MKLETHQNSLVPPSKLEVSAQKLKPYSILHRCSLPSQGTSEMLVKFKGGEED